MEKRKHIQFKASQRDKSNSPFKMPFDMANEDEFEDEKKTQWSPSNEPGSSSRTPNPAAGNIKKLHSHSHSKSQSAGADASRYDISQMKVSSMADYLQGAGGIMQDYMHQVWSPLFNQSIEYESLLLDEMDQFINQLLGKEKVYLEKKSKLLNKVDSLSLNLRPGSGSNNLNERKLGGRGEYNE